MRALEHSVLISLQILITTTNLTRDFWYCTI